MAWEWRGNAGPFYYRARRDGRKVIKEYFGRGERAEQAAREDADRRARRSVMRHTERAETERVRPVARLTNELAADANMLFEAVLLAAGLHRRNYGRWRVRRDG